MEMVKLAEIRNNIRCPPEIIIMPPDDNENISYPTEWLESESDSGICTPDERHTGYNSIGNDHGEGVEPERMHIDEVPGVHRVNCQGKNKPRSLLTLEKAAELVNEIISTGMHTWEFKWMTDGESEKPYRVGWSKVIRHASCPTSKRSKRSYIMKSRNAPYSSARVYSSSSFKEEGGHLRRRNKEMQKPVDILLEHVRAKLLY